MEYQHAACLTPALCCTGRHECAESLQEPLLVIKGIQLLHKAEFPEADSPQSAQLSLHASRLHSNRESQQWMTSRAAAFMLAKSFLASLLPLPLCSFTHQTWLAWQSLAGSPAKSK